MTVSDREALLAALAREQDMARKELDRRWRASDADVPEPALIWVALVPVWTIALAKACAFPSGPGGVEQTVSEMAERGLCESTFVRPELTDRNLQYAQPPPGADQRFSMTPHNRLETLQGVVRDPKRGVAHLQQEMQVIGGRVLGAHTKGVPVPEPVRRWATLAEQAGTPRACAGLLTRQVEELLGRKQSAEALRWIEAAAPIEELLGRELTAALARANGRLELFHRRQHDEPHLRRFLEREGQIRAFEALVDGPDDLWGLHYVGAGGVGKTMLMRYIAGVLAPGRGASSARIDFDYLNPDYPVRAPGLLLAQLAEELRLFAETDVAMRLFGLFDEKVVALHERLSGSLPAIHSPLQSTRGAEFREILLIFADAVEHLPQPVIILLDTCEELAKIRPDGTIPANVQATFAILEGLHNVVPSIRVVFCGRRPLAAAGAGWRCPSSPHPSRPYLQLHEIRGFTRDEAERLLRKKAKIPPGLVDTIIDRSLEPGDVERFEWDWADERPAAVPRYSPFELALLANWAREDHTLTPDQIRAADVDRYVEMRVVGRIRHGGLRDLLPAAALLGRVDYEMLRSATDSPEEEFATIFDELSNQEWVDRQPHRFLQVQQGLAPRLREHFRRTNPAALERVRTRVAGHLEERTLRQRLAELDVGHFDVALRLLEAEPERAARWWDRVEARFAQEQAYEWARGLLERLVADDGAAGEGTLLRAAVLATYNAALTHTTPGMDLSGQWQEVARDADRHPLADGAARLRARAVAGIVATSCPMTEGLPSPPLDELWRHISSLPPDRSDGQVLAAFVTATETVLERMEQRGHAPEGLAAGPVIHLAQKLQVEAFPDLAAFGCSLAGRALSFLGRHVEALEWLDLSIRLAQNVEPGAQRWLDWRAPENLVARIRLEFVRATYPMTRSPKEILGALTPEMPNWESMLQVATTGRAGRKPGDPLTIDEDRLVSALAAIYWADKAPDRQAVEAFRTAQLPPGDAEASCNAHLAFPPMFAAVAERLAAAGRVDEAIGVLEQRRREAELSSTALPSVQAADRALLRICRRMRLHDEGSHRPAATAGTGDLELLWALEGLDGAKTPKTASTQEIAAGLPDGDPERWTHARWRTLYALDPEMGRAAVDWAAQALPIARLEGFLDSSVALDALEVNEVSNRLGLGRPFRKLDPALIFRQALELAEQPDTNPVEALTIMLRIQALEGRRRTASVPPHLLLRLGIRRAAEVALDEGELLALRLPHRALFLLQMAGTWFAQSRDRVSTLIASISCALTLARLGRNDELEKTLARIEKLEPVDGVTTWKALQVVADNPDSELLDVLGPPGWRPWLIRLVACLAWMKDSAVDHGRLVRVDAWILVNYGTAQHGRIALPAELDGWLTSDNNAGWSLADRRPRLLRWMRSVRLAIAGLMVLVMLYPTIYLPGPHFFFPYAGGFLIRRLFFPYTSEYNLAVIVVIVEAMLGLVATFNLRPRRQWLRRWLGPIRGVMASLIFLLVISPALISFLDYLLHPDLADTPLLIAFFAGAGLGLVVGIVSMPRLNRSRAWALLGSLSWGMLTLLALGFLRRSRMLPYPTWDWATILKISITLGLPLGISWELYRRKRAALSWNAVLLFGWVLLAIIAYETAFAIGERASGAHLRANAMLVGAYMLVLFVIVGVITALFWLPWRYLRPGVLRRSHVELQLRSRPATVETASTNLGNGTLELAVIPSRRFALAAFLLPAPFLIAYLQLRRRVRVQTSFTLDTASPYVKSAHALSARTVERLARLERWLRDGSMPLEIQASPDLHRLAWEAIIASPARSRSNPAPLRCRRTVRDVRTARTGSWERRFQVLSWMRDFALEDIARRGWEDVAAHESFTYRITSRETEMLGATLADDGQPQVIHVIGSAIMTASGVRLQLGSSVRKGPTRAEILRAEELVRLFPHMTCCVVQGSPVEELQRSAAEREQAASLRMFGAELFALGVPVIIMLPSLPAGVSSSVLKDVAGSLIEKGPPSKTVLDAADAARTRILSLQAGDPEARFEVAIDVCVYLEDEAPTPKPPLLGRQKASVKGG